MRLGRLNRGEAIAAGSALVLLVAMFLDWFDPVVSGQVGRIAYVSVSSGGSAWNSLGWLSLALMLAAIGAAAAAVLLRLRASAWKPAIPPAAWVAVLGGLATAMNLWLIIDPPGLGTVGGVTINATPQPGAYLGLLAAAGIAYGGYRAMGLRGSSFAQIADALAAKPPRPARAGRTAKPAKRSEKRPGPRS
jgi:hypothetical protein